MRRVYRLVAYSSTTVADQPQLTELWSMVCPSAPQEPAVEGDDVYVVLDTEVQVLDATTGATRWTAGVPARVADFAVREGTLFVTDHPGTLHVFSSCGAASCPAIWAADVGSSGVLSELAIAGDLLYVAGTPADITSGSQLQVFPVDGCGQTSCEAIHTILLDIGWPQELVVAGGQIFLSTHLPISGPWQPAITAFGLPDP